MITFVPEPHLLDSPRGRHWPALRARGGEFVDGPPPSSAEVVVVGAGPAGLAVASALWHHGVRDIVMLDRQGGSCRRFFDRVDLLRQRVLRSPYEHHPGVEGYRDCELLDFARLHWSLLTSVERNEIRMAQAGHRSVVPVDVFEAYCRHITASHHTDRRTWRAGVHRVEPSADSVTVRTDAGSVTAPYVVLCQGEDRREAPGDWSDGVLPTGVSHWDQPAPSGAGPLVVVGAGLSAAHLVSNGLAAGRPVSWVVRETAERYQCADVNSTFFRPEGRARFDNVEWADRLRLMGTFRRASIMFEFRPGFERAEETGQLRVHRGGGVVGLTAEAGGTPAVRLESGVVVGGEHVVLALGTVPSVGTGLMDDELVAVRDGWPDLDGRTLAFRNAPRVFVVGAAAGMVLGPAARNIDGHRVATARVSVTVAAGLGRTGVPAPAETIRPGTTHSGTTHPGAVDPGAVPAGAVVGV